MEQQKRGGIAGFVIYKDKNDAMEMEALKDAAGTIVLFTNYNEAKSESAWLDVVAPVTQRRLEELCRPKVCDTRKRDANARMRGLSIQ